MGGAASARHNGGHSQSPSMSTPVVPSKTALGQDELRHRTHRLSQRHRTVLLLVDGRRSLGEVLGLANHAGAAISHFEELVRLGLVEVPMEEPPPPPEAAVEPATAPDAPQLTSVEMLVPAEDDSSEEAQALPQAEVSVEPEPEPQSADPGPVVVQAPPPEPPPPEPPPRLPPPAPPVLIDVVPPLTEPDEEPVLERARQQLLDLLRMDGPLFGSRLAGRVRDAETNTQLIDLVWEIERQLGMTRRSRQGQLCLERARDLLGLGNTQVAEDTHPGHLD
jgi:hypothetical protein